MIYNLSDLELLESRFRGNLINSLGGFKSLVLVGTQSAQGNPNLALFSSLFHIGANPAVCGMVIRPNEPKQNTLGNILSQKEYTLNHITPEFYQQAHQCSAKYPEGESEFLHTGLTPEYLPEISAPFVKESIVKYACSWVQTIDIELNGTCIIIGRIIKVIIPDQIIGSDGFLALDQAATITCNGLDGYYLTHKINRLKYAQPNIPVQILPDC